MQISEDAKGIATCLSFVEKRGGNNAFLDERTKKVIQRGLTTWGHSTSLNIALTT
jgi:hypothetical protein